MVRKCWETNEPRPVGMDMVVDDEKRQTRTVGEFNQVQTPPHPVFSVGRNSGRGPLVLAMVPVKTISFPSIWFHVFEKGVDRY